MKFRGLFKIMSNPNRKEFIPTYIGFLVYLQKPSVIRVVDSLKGTTPVFAFKNFEIELKANKKPNPIKNSPTKFKGKVCVGVSEKNQVASMHKERTNK